MTKVLDILKEELEIAMILSGIIQNLHILWIVKYVGLGGWGTPLYVQQQRLQFLYRFGLKRAMDFNCLALK